jgi:hypothetical protein
MPNRKNNSDMKGKKGSDNQTLEDSSTISENSNSDTSKYYLKKSQ